MDKLNATNWNFNKCGFVLSWQNYAVLIHGLRINYLLLLMNKESYFLLTRDAHNFF